MQSPGINGLQADCKPSGSLSHEGQAAEKLLATATRMYATADERASMRGALMDAAGLCDAIALDIMAENRGRGGKGAVTKRGMELAAIATRCGDALMLMRKQIKVPSP